MSLHVASPSGPASALIGQNHEGGGYAALWLGVGAVSNSYAYLQGIRASGISYGDLVLNAAGGNVGIGTNAPKSSLHVAGDVTATSFAGRGAVPWQEETNFASSRLMQPNRGYLANSGSRVSFTLPSSPAVGDIVRVSGGGEGGWTVVQNAGQVVSLKELGALGSVWVARESNRNWSAVASSADGSKLVATVYDGEIYTSTNAGVTWTARGITRSWTSVASSQNGAKLAAVVMGGAIYVSANSGVSWTERGFPAQWTSIASSADGTKLVATGWNTRLYTSTDSGVFWYGYGFTNRWNTVVSSADGTCLFAAAETSGIPGYALGVFASTSSGHSWELRSSDNSTLTVATGADGQTAAYAAADLFTSMNNGLTWHAHPTLGRFRHLASSADGRVLLAANANSQLSVSTDYGATWVRRESVRNWSGVACSADGTKFVAVASGGQIHTSSGTTTPGSGWLTGEEGAAIELQYIGGGRWMSLSSQGTINAY